MQTLIWTFPVLMLASIAMGWAAEISALHLSAGIALAVLAWLQTSPEFAVEAVIAWSRDSHLVLANLTGSLRLLMGLGWPMVFFVHWFSSYLRARKGKKKALPTEIVLPESFSVEAVGLGVAVLYFLVIRFHGRWTANDGLVLCGLYGLYFFFLNKQRKAYAGEEVVAHEEDEDHPALVKWALGKKKSFQITVAALLFVFSGALLFITAHPFIEALKESAVHFGISEYVFIQWIAPLASEFPEKITAFNWARKASKVPYAIVNMLSSIISQWTLMAGLVPIIYSISAGHWTGIELSDFQKTEVSLTIAQSALAVVFLLDLKILAYETMGLFVLWLVQFIFPETRHALVYVYSAWIVLELVLLAMNPKKVRVYYSLKKVFKGKS